MNLVLEEFEHIIHAFPEQVMQISEEDFDVKVDPFRWSKKEILGHLIDSAFVNYSRFIRAQFEENPKIYYDQVEYCKSGSYQYSEKLQLCDLWSSINKQLLFLFKQITNKNLTQRTCNDHSLAFLMNDYVSHLQHHRGQILI